MVSSPHIDHRMHRMPSANHERDRNNLQCPMDIVHIVHVTVHWISCQTLDRSQSLFYFVPQESHSQVDSAGQTWSLGSFGKVTILSQSQIFWHKKSKSESQSKTQPVKLIKVTPQLRSLLQTKESQDMRSFTRRSRVKTWFVRLFWNVLHHLPLRC